MLEAVAIERYSRGDRGWKRGVLAGSVGAAKVADVSAHEDEGVRHGTSET